MTPVGHIRGFARIGRFRSFAALPRRAALAVLVALVAGCTSTTTPPPPIDDPLPVPVGYRPLSTPASPLVNLLQTYQHRDDDAVVMLETLMRKGTFVREIIDSTESGLATEHRYWGREKAIFANLFVHDPTVTRAQLIWLTSPADTSSPTPCALVGDPPVTLRFRDRPYTLLWSHGYADSVIAGLWDVYVAPVDTLQRPLRWQIVRWTDTVRSVQPRYRPLTTPAAPIIDLGLCWQHADDAAAAQYPLLFDQSRFVFRYSDDMGAHAWDAAREIAASQALFGEPDARTRLDFLLARADTTTMTASTDPGDPTGTLRCRVTGITFSLRRGGLLYVAEGSADIYVAPVGGLWKIVRWEDNTTAPAGASLRLSWGAVKALY